MKHFRFLIIILFLSCSFAAFSQIKFEQKDKEILEKVFFQLKNDKDKSTSELVVLAGKELKGTPYVAHTLESEPEQLVINLRGLDCTPYAENCLAIARTVKSGKLTFEKFTKEISTIRYRNGKVDGYLSRLHYFSDWIFENDNKNLVKRVSQDIANIPYPLELDFMSTHPDSYKQLKANPAFVPQITQKEKEISVRQMFYLPKEKLPSYQDKLLCGDIIGITTSVAGLDIIHVGIIVKQNGKIHLMHASSKAEKVIISENTLHEYLTGRKSATGIMVIRPL